MRFPLVLGFLAICGLGPSAALAQRYWGPDQLAYCGGDTAADECPEKTLELLLAKLQLPQAETLANEGFTGVRVFQYDAFRTIWPATFMLTKPVNEYRREGTAEAVVVHADGRLATLKRPIWEGGWREMDAAIEAILEVQPAEPAPQTTPTDGPPFPPVCLDPPTIIIEVISAGAVHRSLPNTCNASDAVARARVISENLAAAFPVCGHFPIERYGRGLGRVRACLSVDGEDPFSAAEVMNILQPDVGGHTRVIYEAEHQSTSVTLLGINGQRAAGRAAVLDALKGGALGDRYLRVVRATGDEGGVTVQAELRRVREPNNPDPLPLSVRWGKDGDGAWRISDWSVEQR
jgi:hypothetical protein